VEQFRLSAEQARADAAAAERESRDAARAGDNASAALERLEAQRSGYHQRLADLEPVQAASAEAVACAHAALAALPDPEQLEREVDAKRAAASVLAALVADKRAEAATRARETAADRERQAVATREQGEWRRRTADAEKRLAQARQRRAEHTSERQALEAEPRKLDSEIASLEQASGTAESSVASASVAEQQAEHSRREAPNMLESVWSVSNVCRSGYQCRCISIRLTSETPTASLPRWSN
jgi:chromosome segregation protein